jgi:hypothetical protein
VSRPRKFRLSSRLAIDFYRSSEGRTIADVARELGIGTGMSVSRCAETRRIVVSGRTG